MNQDETALSSPARLRLTEALNDENSGTYGGFPIRFLLYMTGLSKVISLKKKYVDKLKQMNSQVELQQPFGGIRKEFQKDYAFVVLELEKINKEMDSMFQGIQSFLQNDAAKIGIYDQSNVIKDRCHEAATELVQQSHQILQDECVKELIVNLTSLMLQINNIAEGESGAFELSSLDDAVREIKCSLRADNVKLFEDKVETSIAFMKNGLQEEQSMLAAFSNNKQKKSKSNNNKNTLMESLDFSSAEEFDDDEEEEEEELIDPPSFCSYQHRSPYADHHA